MICTSLRRKRFAGLSSIAFLCITLAPDQSGARSDDAVDRFCVMAVHSWANRSEEDTPKFEGGSPRHRGMESYWRHSYRGVSVPIPMNTDGWWFSFFDSNTTKGLAALHNDQLNIHYGFTPSILSGAVRKVGKIARDLGLPASDLTPMALLRLALTIDADAADCDPNNVQSTVSDFSAVFLKAFVLTHHDHAYLHEGGVLGHSVVEIGENWTYVFEGRLPGSLYQITIRNENPGQFQYIGFEIADTTLSDSIHSPPWMPMLFETLTEPTKDHFFGLREYIVDYSFPEYTFENLDEKLAQFE